MFEKIALLYICNQRGLGSTPIERDKLVNFITKDCAKLTDADVSNLRKVFENVDRKTKKLILLHFKHSNIADSPFIKGLETKIRPLLMTVTDIQSLSSNFSKAANISKEIQKCIFLKDESTLETLKTELKTIRSALIQTEEDHSFEGYKKQLETLKDTLSAIDTLLKKEIKKKCIRVYKKVDVSDSSSSTDISITFLQLKEEIKKDEFIKNICESSRMLMAYKRDLYRSILKDVKAEVSILTKKIEKLPSNKRDAYPMYDFLICFQFDLEELIETISKKELDFETVKLNIFRAVYDPTFGIECISGRKNIKDSIARQIYAFSKSFKTFTGAFNNIMICGSPGSGKTFLANVISFVYSNIGIMARNHIKVITRADLVGGYIGQTATKTRALLLGGLEGVIFIDEAYQLCPRYSHGTNDFGNESVTELVNFLDKYIGLSTVIVAGYKDRMYRDFLGSNEGMQRRFPAIYDLSPYSIAELSNILISNIEKKLDYALSEEDCNIIYSLICDYGQSYFKNQAGDMLNISSTLLNVINSSYGISWSDNRKLFIKKAFKNFEEQNISLRAYDV